MTGPGRTGPRFVGTKKDGVGAKAIVVVVTGAAIVVVGVDSADWS